MDKTKSKSEIRTAMPMTFTEGLGKSQEVQCELCPRTCLLRPGQNGNCRIRANIDGKMVLTTYGLPCALHVDPVEKKPLFHFLPGTKAFSVATVGCNLHCKNCQNWEISQAFPGDVPAHKVPPNKLVQLAKKHQCASIAYTYTDPVVFYEYAYDSSVKAKAEKIKNILVTAGYINKKPFKELCRFVDAANIDLKAFSDKFYRDICKATLKPVLEALVLAKSAGVMVEVTNLLIPTLNDKDIDIKKLCEWIKKEMGPETPLHFSRFFPHYRMRSLPPTPMETLTKARNIAKSAGLKHVYVGNLSGQDWENTACPKCQRVLIKRQRYRILENNIKNAKCDKCGEKIYGIWQ